MVRGRLVAAGLVMALLGPSVTALADGRMAAACTDEICRCAHAHRAPPKAPASCHETARRPEPECRMTARCTHESAAIPQATKPALAIALLTVGADQHPLATVPIPARDPHAGFSRIDSPPPRTS